MQPVRKISVDEPLPNSYHLSQWHGNETPKALKADTATEIALKFISDPNNNALFPQTNIVTSSHFNSDSLLAVFSLLYPKRAEPIAKILIEISEAHDFSSFSSESGVQAHLLIEALSHSNQSPFRKRWWHFASEEESFYYNTIITEIDTIIKKKNDYRYLWKDRFDKIVASMELFEKRKLWVEEYKDEKLSVIINDTRPEPQAIDYYCKGDAFLIAEDKANTQTNGNGRYAYELCYRYYSWADTVRRPAILKASLNHLADHLNKNETSKSGKWIAAPENKKPLSTVALTFADDRGNRALSALLPDKVTESVLYNIRKNKGRD
ncbi:MAG: DUF6687 family protein [Nitrospirota bacterium]